MNFIERISEERKTFGYKSGEYKKYSKHCKNMISHHKRREGPQSAIYYLYKAENEFTKHFLATKTKFIVKSIKKAIRFAKQHSVLECFEMIYNAQLQFILKEYEKAFSIATSSRKYFIGNHILLQEIDNLIRDCNKNDNSFFIENITQKWHDIELSFESAEDSRIFFSFTGKKIIENNFESELKNFIFKFEILKTKFEKLIEKDTKRIKCLYEKSRQLRDFTEKFNSFLVKNYLKSEFIQSYFIGATAVNQFYMNLKNRNDGNLSEDDTIESFQVPVNFSKSILDSKFNNEIHTKNIKNQLFTKLIKKVEIEDNDEVVPFIPVFYDLADEYIKYPTEKVETSSISSFISKFSSFSFRK